MSKTNYSEDFKRSSAKLAVESEQSVSQTARELGININTLRSWIIKYYPKRPLLRQDGLSLQEELKQLKKENTRLKQERDILKKAAAYFASETQ